MSKRYFEYGDIRYELKENKNIVPMYLWDMDPDTCIYKWVLIEVIQCDNPEEAEDTFNALAKIIKVDEIVEV